MVVDVELSLHLGLRRVSFLLVFGYLLLRTLCSFLFTDSLRDSIACNVKCWRAITLLDLQGGPPGFDLDFFVEVGRGMQRVRLHLVGRETLCDRVCVSLGKHLWCPGIFLLRLWTCSDLRIRVPSVREALLLINFIVVVKVKAELLRDSWTLDHERF